MQESLVKACEHALKHNLAVQPGESVLIVTDEQKRPIADAFQSAARQFSDRVELIEIPIPEFNGQEPPPFAAEKMKHADVILMPLTKSLSWTKARMAATAAGARIASMARITEDIILRTFPIDYRPIRQRVNRICDLLDEASVVHVTTELGTDIHIGVQGRKAHGRKSAIFTEKGAWGNLPCGEAFIAPLEGTSNGLYLVDASQAGVGKLSQPIRITVKSGLVVEITGGPEASSFARMVKAVGDPNAYNIAEFGIGCNDKATICGITLEDEKTLGTCHLALGSNIFFDGKVDVGLHVDGVIRNPTIVVDEQKVMVDGKLLI